VAETLFHTLKVELIQGKAYNTRQEAKVVVFEYIGMFKTGNVAFLSRLSQPKFLLKKEGDLINCPLISGRSRHET
jgi:hypothetical protein